VSLSISALSSRFRVRHPVTLLIVALAVVAFGYAIFTPWPYEAEERALCDRSVAALLTSKDLVEVTRAGMIVDRLKCRIGQRIGTASTP
jgi:hypothetical protein